MARTAGFKTACPLGVTVSVELRAQLKAMAEDTRTPLSWLVQDLLTEALATGADKTSA